MADKKHDLGDEAHIEELGKKEKVKSNREIDDIKFLMRTPQFLRYIHGVLAYCRPTETPFNTNALVMARNTGALEVGNFIMAKLNDADAKFMVKLIEEREKNV